MKFEIIKPANGDYSKMTDDQMGWMYLCEEVASRWYGLMKMDDFARLVHIKHPEIESRTIRDAYLEVYYTQEEELENAENAEDVWITLLTPLVDENGIEYLADNQLAEHPESLDQLAGLHKHCKMYLPEEEEIHEYFHYGFCITNQEIIDCIEELSNLLDMREAKKAEHLKEWLEEGEKSIRSYEEQNGPVSAKEKGKARRNLLAEHIIAHETQLLEKNYAIADVMNAILASVPFKTGTRQKVIEQLGAVFENTHLPGNNGNTPIQMVDFSNQKKPPVF